MKTLDQINEEIQKSVTSRIQAFREGGGILTMDEFDETDSHFEPRLREHLKNEEVSDHFRQLLEISTVLEKYLNFYSTDGTPKCQLLRNQMKELLAKFNS